MMDFRDELYFLAVTVAMEAGGEAYDGKQGVAFAIVNRPGSITDIVLKAYQFSAWNTDSNTRMNIDTIPDAVYKECYKAAVGAYFKIVEDLTKGATHYLNEELTKQLRGGTLPGWFSEDKVTIRIGKHTFLKLA
jgi:hypothetical protein